MNRSREIFVSANARMRSIMAARVACVMNE